MKLGQYLTSTDYSVNDLLLLSNVKTRDLDKASMSEVSVCGAETCTFLNWKYHWPLLPRHTQPLRTHPAAA